MDDITIIKLIGLGCVLTTVGAGLLCYQMWTKLPINQRVWAIVLLLGVCSVLTFWPAAFFLLYVDRSATVAPY